MSRAARQRFLCLATLAAMAVVHARAQQRNSPHNDSENVSGLIRIWGDDRMQTLLKYWEEGFRKEQPGVRFETKLLGTGTGMAGLYAGVADLALMGRESTPSEAMAFEWVFRYRPLGIQVATGSVNVPGKTFAVTLFVNKVNPLSQLTLAQLDAIFGSEHRRGPGNVRTWGELGLTGAWRDKLIHPYGYDFETGTAWFLKRTVFAGSDKWNCAVKEFADWKRADGTLVDAGGRILDALARDRYGIAYSNLGFVNPEVKPIALAAAEGLPYYEATRESVRQRQYPLTRAAWVYVNRAPGKLMDLKAKKFLGYVLSDQGQQETTREGDFLPLSEHLVRDEKRKLD